MLTGWDLQFACDDEHLREVGVWIDEVSFASGTLSYRLSSNMRDNNAPPGFRMRPDVVILGLNAYNLPRVEPVDEIFVGL
jgi:hypothetical protein